MKKINFHNPKFSGEIKFYTPSGDDEMDFDELIEKIEIIRQFFPFKWVDGYVNLEEGVYLAFDNGLFIIGLYNGEPHIFRYIFPQITFNADFHPYDGQGGLCKSTFKEILKNFTSSGNLF